MTITVYNEAGEVVTDPHELAQCLWSAFRPNEVRVYGDEGTLLAARGSGPVAPTPTLLQWLAAKFMRAGA